MKKGRTDTHGGHRQKGVPFTLPTHLSLSFPICSASATEPHTKKEKQPPLHSGLYHWGIFILEKLFLHMAFLPLFVSPCLARLLERSQYKASDHLLCQYNGSGGHPLPIPTSSTTQAPRTNTNISISSLEAESHTSLFQANEAWEIRVEKGLTVPHSASASLPAEKV